MNLNLQSIFNKLTIKFIVYIITFIFSFLTGLDKIYHLQDDQPESSRDAERRTERYTQMMHDLEVQRYKAALERQGVFLTFEEASERMKAIDEAEIARIAEQRRLGAEHGRIEEGRIEEASPENNEEQSNKILPAPGNYTWSSSEYKPTESNSEYGPIQSETASTSGTRHRLANMLLQFTKSNLDALDEDIKKDNLHEKDESQLKDEESKLLEERQQHADFLAEFNSKLSLSENKRSEFEIEETNDKKRSKGESEFSDNDDIKDNNKRARD